MNQDVGQLIKSIKIKNPMSVAAVASLAVSMALFGILAASALRAMNERREAQTEVDSALASVRQLEQVQKQSPVTLSQRIAEIEAQLRAALTGFPTKEQASAELVRYYAYAEETATQLVRLEKMIPSPQEEAYAIFQEERFALEVHGEATALLRFLGRVAGGPYATFLLNAIDVVEDTPAVADASLTVYSSSLILGAGPAEGESSPGEPLPAEPATGPGEGDALSALRAQMREALAAENWALAVASGERILRAVPVGPDLAQSLYDAHVGWARAFLAQNRPREAVAQYREALRVLPNGAEAQRELGALQVTPDTPASPLPTPDVQMGPSATTTRLLHTVRSGESLSLLARRYGTTVNEIMQANNLRSTTIYVGQELVIPRE